MKIQWIGHACFQIETESYTIITDPIDEQMGYPCIPEQADIVTVSHEHFDHNALHVFKNEPEVVRGVGVYEKPGLKIEGFASFHDPEGGRLRGDNTIFKMVSEGIHLVHLGDLGHILSAPEVQSLGQVDILLIPVGGTYTIDDQGAYELVQKIQPRIVIPMHYLTPVVTIDIAPLEAFTARYPSFVKKPALSINAAGLPEKTEIIVLDYLSG